MALPFDHTEYMVRGFVYSIVAICVFLLGSIIYMTTSNMEDSATSLAGGWLMLLALFGIGPLFFGLGYWHNRRLHPDEPHWDSETGE